MKTQLFNSVLCALTMALAVNCAKEKYSLEDAAVCGDVTFEAEYVDGHKTTLDGTDVLWCPGDKIKIYQGSLASGDFTSTITANSKKSSFTGYLQTALGEMESTPGQKGFWAVYPSSAAYGCDGTSVTVQVEATQQAVEGTFASGLFPAVAKSTDYTLGFYNVCGGIKFSVAQSGIRKVVLRGATSEKLAGKVKVAFNGGYPVVTEVIDGKDSIIVNAPDANGFLSGKSYYIVALPASLQNGFSLEYNDQYGKVTFSSASAVTIKRKTFGVLEEKDLCGILFRDKVAKAACVAKFDASGDGEVSFDEAAAATTLEGLFSGHEGVQYFPELKHFTSVKDLKGCFTDCAKLKEIKIPSFITALGEKAFYGCSSLPAVTIPASVKTIDSEAFRNCTALAAINFNEGLETLGARAFYSIAAVEITLPASIKTIGNRTFWNEVSAIIMAGTVPPSLAAVSFGTNTKFYVPDEALTTYKTAEGWEDFEEYIYPISEYCRIDLSASGTANCYVVNTEGKYMFNAMYKGGSIVALDGIPLKAEVLWESFGTDITPNVGDIVKSVFLDDEYVKFSTPSTFANGNAVIAVKDASDNILWSWHIWVCKDFDPTATAQVYKNSAGTMMDRNLGATSATPGDVHALGLLYQWGRKDPFLSGQSISSTTVAKSTLSWPSPVSSNASQGTIAYAVAHPTTFITYNGKNSDWYYTGSSSTDNTRWQTSDKTKGIYDPCPLGWRVPDGGSNGVWSKAFGSSSSWTTASNWDSTNKGMDFGSTDRTLGLGAIWYPAAGYRLYSGGSLFNVGYGGGYWPCAPNGGFSYYLYFCGPGYVDPSRFDYRSLGQSVRCLSE